MSDETRDVDDVTTDTRQLTRTALRFLPLEPKDVIPVLEHDRRHESPEGADEDAVKAVSASH